MPLCNQCQNISPWALKGVLLDSNTGILDPALYLQHHENFLALERSSPSCALCLFLHQALITTDQATAPDFAKDAPIVLAAESGTSNLPHNAFSVPGPQIHRIIVQCGTHTKILEALAVPDSEAARSHAVAGRFAIDPESEEGFTMIKGWLGTCLRSHRSCRMTKYFEDLPDDLEDEMVELPTRVLDVGDGNVKLVECSKIEGQYVTLSHRWPTDPWKHFTSTHATLEKRKSGIGVDELPATFRDAVTVTRQLGIRYLWIDSLCILQDDKADWERESAVMGNIYHRSTVTLIAATVDIGGRSDVAQQQQEGFLRRGPVPWVPMITLPYISLDGKAIGSWYLRLEKLAYITQTELGSRGWVLQEEMLSRRRLTYHSDRVLWHCDMIGIHESGRDIRYEYSRKNITPKERQQKKVRAIDVYFSDEWAATASVYSARSLTMPLDKLPALSGLASHFAARHRQTYHAGLFSACIPEGLAWRPRRPGCTKRVRDERGERLYIAPSWSWLSVDGEVKMKGPRERDRDVWDPNFGYRLRGDSAIGNVIFDLVPSGKDPNGMLESGKMMLIGVLRAAKMRRGGRSQPDIPLLKLEAEGGKSMGNFYVDIADEVPKGAFEANVECLQLLFEGEEVLVLRKVGEPGARMYERVGVAEIDPEWFYGESARKEFITIV